MGTTISWCCSDSVDLTGDVEAGVALVCWVISRYYEAPVSSLHTPTPPPPLLLLIRFLQQPSLFFLAVISLRGIYIFNESFGCYFSSFFLNSLSLFSFTIYISYFFCIISFTMCIFFVLLHLQPIFSSSSYSSFRNTQSLGDKRSDLTGDSTRRTCPA